MFGEGFWVVRKYLSYERAENVRLSYKVCDPGDCVCLSKGECILTIKSDSQKVVIFQIEEFSWYQKRVTRNTYSLSLSIYLSIYL